MTSSHIWFQNANQAFCAFSKLCRCSWSPFEFLVLDLLTRKHYFSFEDPVALLVLILTHTRHLVIFDSKNTNQAPSCILKL